MIASIVSYILFSSLNSTTIVRQTSKNCSTVFYGLVVTKDCYSTNQVIEVGLYSRIGRSFITRILLVFPLKDLTKVVI